jgi:hypothetical protein
MDKRLLELDFAIRQAVLDRNGETVLRLADAQNRAIQDLLDQQDGEGRERLARQIRDLLARSLELAQSVREHLRLELNAVASQRQLAGNSKGSAPIRTFRA